MNVIYVFIGGGLGAVMRYALAWILGDSTQGFPVGIIVCNLLGCFAMGLLYGWSRGAQLPWLNPLVMTGVLGGFTTFSAFALDSQKLIQAQQPIMALLYVLCSVFGCIVACFVGWRISAS